MAGEQGIGSIRGDCPGEVARGSECAISVLSLYSKLPDER